MGIHEAYSLAWAWRYDSGLIAFAYSENGQLLKK